MIKYLIILNLIFLTEAHAIHVLGYEMYFEQSQPNGGKTFTDDEMYSVLVFLPDAQARNFRIHDDLKGQLYANRYEGNPDWARNYLKYVVEPWYFEQIRRYPRIYQNKQEEVIAGLKNEEPILDGNSSVVVFTQFRNPFKPLTTLRAVTVGADGLVPNEKHYLNRGLKGTFPRKKVEKVQRKFPRYHLQKPFNFLNIQFPDARIPSTDDEEELIELKSWGVGEEVEAKKFWLYSYLVARKHRIVFQGASGRRVSRVALDAFGPILRRRYQRFSFVDHDTVENEWTYGIPLHFMYADVWDLDQTVMTMAEAQLRPERKWLVPDRHIVNKIRSCGGYIAD